MNAIEQLINTLQQMRKAAGDRHIQPEALEEWVRIFNRSIYLAILADPEAAEANARRLPDSVQRVARRMVEKSDARHRHFRAITLPDVFEAASEIFDEIRHELGADYSPFCFWYTGR